MCFQCIIFNFKNAIKFILRKKFFTISIIFSLFLGMLFPILVLCYANSLRDYISSSKLKNADKVIMIDMVNDGGKISEVEDIILARIKEIEQTTRYSFSKEYVLATNDKCSLQKIILVDSYFREFFPVNIVRGRWFSDKDLSEGDPVCIAGDRAIKELFGDKKEDYVINILGNKFEVVGITNMLKYSDSIIVPAAYAEKVNIKSVFYYLYFRFKDSTKIKDLYEIFENVVRNDLKANYKIVPGVNIEKSDIAYIYTIVPIMFLIASIVLLYSILNIMNILIHKVDETKRNIGIMIALGASNKDIYAQSLFEFCTYTIIASSASCLLIFEVSRIIASTSYDLLNLNLTVMGFTVLISLIISVVLSATLVRKVMKLNIADIFR